jgi:hypothetical protein
MFFLNELNVSTGYCANLKRLVNMRELKFNFGCMNSHDCHVIMTHLLLVALHGPLPNHKVVLILQCDLTKCH